MTTTITWRGDAWRQAIVPAINAGLTEAARVCSDEAVRILNGPSPSPPGSPPGLDTGHLARSQTYVSPEAAGTPLKAHFGTAVAYGRHLEFGAFITPKRTKYLAVPVDRMLAAKFTKGRLGGSLRGVPGLKYIPPGKGKKHGGRLVLVNSVRVNVRGPKRKQRTASAGKTVFVLKDSVRVHKRPWIMRAAIGAKPAAMAAAHAECKKRMMAEGLVTH